MPAAKADAGAAVNANANAGASANANATANEQKTRELEERVKALEARAAAAAAPAAVPVPAPDTGATVRVEREPSLTGGLTGPLGLVFSGYVQAQYEHSQISEDQLQQGGTPLNQDRFSVRRARLRVDRAWTWASTAIEIDGNTVRGPLLRAAPGRGITALAQSRPRRAAVRSAHRGPQRDPVRLRDDRVETEVASSWSDRPARWRSFRGEPDVGIRLSGGLAFFRYSVAALNGEPIDDRPGRIAGDPNSAQGHRGARRRRYEGAR